MCALSNVRLGYLVLCGAVAAALAGCGEAPVAATEPDAFPFVQCKVVMGGKDVPGAIVTLHPEGDGKGLIVSAYDSEGDCYRFITTVDGTKKAGVPAGEYAVTIKSPRGSRVRIPDKYANPKTSGLTAKIVEGNNFLPPFELVP